jgi:hypothetical protein
VIVWVTLVCPDPTNADHCRHIEHVSGHFQNERECKIWLSYVRWDALAKAGTRGDCVNQGVGDFDPPSTYRR